MAGPFQVNLESVSGSRCATQHLVCVDSEGSQRLSHGWISADLAAFRRLYFGVSRRPEGIGGVSCRSSLAETLLSSLGEVSRCYCGAGFFYPPHRLLGVGRRTVCGRPRFPPRSSLAFEPSILLVFVVTVVTLAPWFARAGQTVTESRAHMRNTE